MEPVTSSGTRRPSTTAELTSPRGSRQPATRCDSATGTLSSQTSTPTYFPWSPGCHPSLPIRWSGACSAPVGQCTSRQLSKRCCPVPPGSSPEKIFPDRPSRPRWSSPLSAARRCIGPMPASSGPLCSTPNRRSASTAWPRAPSLHLTTPVRPLRPTSRSGPITATSTKAMNRTTLGRNWYHRGCHKNTRRRFLHRSENYSPSW